MTSNPSSNFPQKSREVTKTALKKESHLRKLVISEYKKLENQAGRSYQII
jgi:hypothetical protein